jgi:hypothetical protein
VNIEKGTRDLNKMVFTYKKDSRKSGAYSDDWEGNIRKNNRKSPSLAHGEHARGLKIK